MQYVFWSPWAKVIRKEHLLPTLTCHPQTAFKRNFDSESFQTLYTFTVFSSCVRFFVLAEIFEDELVLVSTPYFDENYICMIPF